MSSREVHETPAFDARDPIVEIIGVEKAFGSHEVLKNVSLQVQRGEVVVIIGRSGSGKTTLLRCINFLETYDKGEIRVAGELMGYRRLVDGSLERRRQKEVARSRLNVGMVFQSFNLFPHRSAIENITMAPIHVRKVAPDQAKLEAVELLRRVGLSDKADEFPGRLSGGQQQRLAIARALAMQPAVLLFDEVTSALDPELVSEVLAVIRDLAEDGATMIIVTHELAFARDVADRIVYMADGRIVEEGPPAILLSRPKDQGLERLLHRFLREDGGAPGER